jgi:hypothetical protein
MRFPHERVMSRHAERRRVRYAHALGAALALLVCSASIHAQSVRMLVQSSPLAGFRYHEAREVFPQLRLGDRLDLSREPDNAYDANAIRVEWRGHKLGYVPRAENHALSGVLDRGEPVTARISALRANRNPRRRIEFEVFIE